MQRQEFGLYSDYETGKPLLQAAGETADAADRFECYSGETLRIYGQTIEARVLEVRMRLP